jgi:hypothetical protein
MIMRFSITHKLGLAAIAAFATTGLMQGSEIGTFYLPTATHWGQALLEPGSYKVYLPDFSPDQLKLRVEGAGKAVYEMPVVTDVQSNSASNYLKLSEIDGIYFIREFSSGATGKTFTFAVPETSRREEAVAVSARDR